MRVSVDGHDLAEIATSGVPDISTPEKLALCSYAVHRAVLQRTASLNEDTQRMERNGIPGWKWRGWVNKIIEEMWAWMREDLPEVATVKRQLNRYLNASGNLICLTPGSKTTPSTWWVRGEFSDIVPDVSQAKNPAPATTVKVTPHEAGEDRKPAPVTTGYVCTWLVDGKPCGERFGKDSWLNHHIYTAHRSVQSWITEAMHALGRPALISEIYEMAAGAGDFPGSDAMVGRTLTSMFEAGTVMCDRPAERNGRRYWLPGTPKAEQEPAALPPESAPEPPKTPPEPPSYSSSVAYEGQRFACREPNCTHSLFTRYDDREAHEDFAHLNSAARKWACVLCNRTFYQSRGLSVHLIKTHHLPRDSDGYAAAWTRMLNQQTSTPVPEPAPPVSPVQAPAADQAMTYLKAIIDENIQLKSDCERLAAENQQLTARLRRIRATAGE
jgi:hypothetical protein